MLSKLFETPISRCSFEDVQVAMKQKAKYVIINTLPVDEQGCLIKNTTSFKMEESLVNDLMKSFSFKEHVFVVYGKNANDETAEQKYKQLVGLGFKQVILYSGGLFEWLLLQDIYGEDEFPTSSKVLDILHYKSSKHRST